MIHLPQDPNPTPHPNTEYLFRKASLCIAKAKFGVSIHSGLVESRGKKIHSSMVAARRSAYRHWWYSLCLQIHMVLAARISYFRDYTISGINMELIILSYVNQSSYYSSNVESMALCRLKLVSTYHDLNYTRLRDLNVISSESIGGAPADLTS